MHILVHVHLYYFDMWPELKRVLKNITAPYDLFVTVTEQNADIEKDILTFNPEAHLITVENKGFDIWPFITVLNNIDLNNYSYVIKLHTKRDMPVGTIENGFDVDGDKWRRYLFSFLQSKKLFEKCLHAFESDKTLGMAADYRLIVKNDQKNHDAIQKAQAVLSDLALQTTDLSYVMGTMFIARANLFSKIKEMDLTADYFKLSQHNSTDILPYAFERLFGFLITAQNFQIRDVLKPYFWQIFGKIIARLKNFVWRKKVTSSGKIIFKFCKIPVFASKAKGGCNAL